MSRYARLMTGLLVAMMVLALDQYSKWEMAALFAYSETGVIPVFPGFNLSLVWNKGVSFGMFAGHDQPMILSGVAIVISIILLIWLAKTPYRAIAIALGLVIGGAIGNVIDRFRFGAVFDFLDFHIGPYHWPAFNIADSAIFIGVVVLCLHGMVIEGRKDHDKNDTL